MKTSRFSDSQILAILKQAEAGTPVPDLCREQGISSAIFYKWRAKFGGMDASLEDGTGWTVCWKGKAQLRVRFDPKALRITMS